MVMLLLLQKLFTFMAVSVDQRAIKTPTMLFFQPVGILFLAIQVDVGGTL